MLLVTGPPLKLDFETEDLLFPETDSAAIPRVSSAGLGVDALFESSFSFSRCGKGDGQGEGAGLTGGRAGAPVAAMRARYCSPSRHIRFCTSRLHIRAYSGESKKTGALTYMHWCLHVLLLRADNRSWPHDSHPTNNFLCVTLGQFRYGIVIGYVCGHLCSEAIVLHDVAANDRTGPPKTRLTMDGDRPGSFFALRKKLRQDVVRGIRTVHKVEFHVLDPVVTELATVIRRLVQSDYQSDVALLEIGDIVFWSQRIVTP